MPFLSETSYPIPTKDILSWYFDNSTLDQNAPVYVDAENTDRFWTPAQCKKAIKQLAAGFKALGLQGWPDRNAQSDVHHAGGAPLPHSLASPGDTVCVLSFNDLNYPILCNGILGFGGVYTGANPAYTAFELAHHLKASNTQLVVAEVELLPNLIKAAEQVGLSKDRILIFDNHGEKVPDGFRSWWSLFEHGEMDWKAFDDLETARNTTAALLFSSGTTGLPKAVMLSHYNLVAEQTLAWDSHPTPFQKRKLIMLPMFHASMAPSGHFAPLHCGDLTFIARRFDLESYLRLMQKHKITEGAFVPPMVHMIISSPLMKTEKYKDSLKSVRIAIAGAAPLDVNSQNRLYELMHPEASFTQVWGMTETSCTCSTTYWDDPEVYEAGKWGSVGKMLPNMDAKVVDDDGKDVSADGVRGELCVRGPLVTKGYHKNEEANARDWDEDGFFHTGDIAYRDEKTKHWYIVNRKKELIKVRGLQVAPSEIEGVLLDHPSIIDVAVIGIPAPLEKDGEEPRAYIVVQPDMKGKVSVEDVRKHVSERLARYKQITGGVVFVDVIPKTASGKILKRVIKEQVKVELEREGRGDIKARM